MRLLILPLLLGCCLFAACSTANSLTVTPDYRITAHDLKTPAGTAAAELLSGHLEKAFGRPVPVADGKQLSAHDLVIELSEDPALGEEEWRIRTWGNRVQISGGVPRGLYFGVCEFLERFAGVRWFTAWETKIPRLDSFSVPEGEIRGAPAFPYSRYVYDALRFRENTVFHVHNRASGFSAGPPVSGFTPVSIGNGHSFYRLTKALPKELEHCLPVNEKGVRIRSVTSEGPGQICFSSPEFREFSKHEIAKWIETKRAELQKNGRGNARIAWIDLSANDNQNFCQCGGCRELYRKYGTVSGAQLEFINDIASAFPDQTFQTFAYGKSSEPPEGIRARENVMVQFAFLSVDGKSCDLLRPLTASTNAPLRAMYEKWSEVVDKKAVWAYQRVFSMTEMFPWPQCCYWYIPEDIRYYHRIGIRKFFAESEYPRSPRAFHDLHVYLSFRMLNDPDCDAEALIREFFEFQYGPAAPAMRNYADYLKRRLDAVPGTLNQLPIPARSCFDAEFFRIIDGFLTEAEKLAGDDPGLLKRIAVERVPVDMAALYMWDKYGKQVFGSRDKICDRLESCVAVMLDRYFPGKSKAEEAVRNFERKRLERLRNPIPIPPGMEDLNIVQVAALDGIPDQQVDDPDALYGRALKCPPVSERWAHEKHPLQFGVYDMIAKEHLLKKVFKPEELAQDEKYHLYFIGRTVPNVYHRITLWGHVSWSMRLLELLKPALDVTDPDREMDIYVSCKVTGPAYVKGSQKENAVYVDKVVCVKRENVVSNSLPSSKD